MRNWRIFSVFLLIYISHLNCDEENLVNYVCKIAEKLTTSSGHIGNTDVAIGNFSSKMPPEFINEIVKCISKETMVLTTDFGKVISEKKLKFRNVFILTDEHESVSFFTMLSQRKGNMEGTRD